MHYRYEIRYRRNVRIGWLDYTNEQHTELAKDRNELKVLVACINEDASIPSAFFIDKSNGSVVHFKEAGEALPVSSTNLK